MRGLLAAFLVFTSLGVSAAKAAPIAIVGGETRVLVTANLPSLGLAADLVGTASGAPGGAISFPITGGSLDGIAGTLLHEGSGITLTGMNTSAGMSTVFAGNFIVDTINETIFGDVTVDGVPFADDADLFSFDAGSVTVAELLDVSNPSLALLITTTLGNALNAVFGAPTSLIGAQFGLAATDPIPTPIPGALWLFAAGAAGLTAAGRRRKKA